ncbi:hypothetical protein AMTRI_Chr06g171490 [Amborella trichopoda]
MSRQQGRIKAFFSNRWLVFVAAMWVQSVAGIGYLFGGISPVIKSSLNYNQRQLAMLSVAKNFGDSVGFVTGSLSAILPTWGALLVGAVQNFIGYGWVWLIVTGRLPHLPLFAMCVLIFIGTNGETYYNTASLVSCVQNFPKHRGPIVGILKGFAGLSGAILTQIYDMINIPDQAALIFMIAVGPAMVVIALMFFVRPVGGHRQIRASDASSFTFVFSVCLLLAAYLMGVLLLEDLTNISHDVTIVFTVILFILVLLPIVIPLKLHFSEDSKSLVDDRRLKEPLNEEADEKPIHTPELILSEVEDEKPREVDLLPASERRKRIAELQARLLNAAAKGAVRVKRSGPHRGEDFTLMQALIKADFWLIFFSLLLGSGSGVSVIDNLGQMSQSLGYDNTHIFVSMISIWNFLGRVGGGYFSEMVVSNYAYPRPVAIAIAQLVMAFGHFLLAMAWPGIMYVGTVLIGLGYGAHWAIVPATASELFGLKNFGALYNFITMANPAGSLLFSGLIASTLYDHEAEKQAQVYHPKTSSVRVIWHMFSSSLSTEKSLVCDGAVCFFLTLMIMSGLCIVAAILSMIVVYRTKVVYAHLYGKSRS